MYPVRAILYSSDVIFKRRCDVTPFLFIYLFSLQRGKRDGHHPEEVSTVTRMLRSSPFRDSRTIHTSMTLMSNADTLLISPPFLFAVSSFGKMTTHATVNRALSRTLGRKPTRLRRKRAGWRAPGRIVSTTAWLTRPLLRRRRRSTEPPTPSETPRRVPAHWARAGGSKTAAAAAARSREVKT